jgi:hypothetical protein
MDPFEQFFRMPTMRRRYKRPVHVATPTQRLQDQETEVMVREALREMVQHIRVKLNKPDWSCRLKLRFEGSKLRCSRGGLGRDMKPYISLALNTYRWGADFANQTFEEYKSFAWDRVIGSLRNVTKRTCVRAIVAHELAHAVQFTLMFKMATASEYAHGGVNDRGHGVLWKEIYRDLRINFVNGENNMSKKNEVKAVEVPVTTEVATPAPAAKRKAKAKPVDAAPTEAPVEAPAKVTKRSQVNAIVAANTDKKTSEVVALIMSTLSVKKSFAYTYFYLAKKDLAPAPAAA